MKNPTFVITRAIAVAATISVAPIFSATAQNQDQLARGKYLVESIGGCGNYHTARGGPMKGVPLAGGNAFGGPKAPFHSYATNITPDRETGIGAWTDDQIVRAIREGRRPDGSIIGPPMAIEFFSRFSDNDVKAMVAYLRMVKPVKNKTPKAVSKMKLRPGHAVDNVPDVSRSDKVAYGQYLVRIGHCMECHTTMDEGRLLMKTHYSAGGRTFRGPWGESVAANITQDRETGIGAWTDAQIKHAIAKGKRHDGSGLRPPMCYRCYDRMTDADLDAVVAYLRTVKPIRNAVR